MSFLNRLYAKLLPAPELGAHPSTPETRAEAADAIQRANSELSAVFGRKPQVAEVASKLRDQLERNHFGELVEASMRRAS